MEAMEGNRLARGTRKRIILSVLIHSDRHHPADTHPAGAILARPGRDGESHVVEPSADGDLLVPPASSGELSSLEPLGACGGNVRSCSGT